MKEILTIIIMIISTVSVSNGSQKVNMLSFGGHAESEFFTGDVLPGGMDTQKMDSVSGTLSARYMLKGKDCKGENCSIFIENNATFGHEYTEPRIVTDSKALSFLNTAKLKGKLDNKDGKLTIRIYQCDKE